MYGQNQVSCTANKMNVNHHILTKVGALPCLNRRSCRLFRSHLQAVDCTQPTVHCRRLVVLLTRPPLGEDGVSLCVVPPDALSPPLQNVVQAIFDDPVMLKGKMKMMSSEKNIDMPHLIQHEIHLIHEIESWSKVVTLVLSWSCFDAWNPSRNWSETNASHQISILQVLQLDFSSGVCPHGHWVEAKNHKVMMFHVGRIASLKNRGYFMAHLSQTFMSTSRGGGMQSCFAEVVPWLVSDIKGFCFIMFHVSVDVVMSVNSKNNGYSSCLDQLEMVWWCILPDGDLDRVLDELLKRCPAETKCIFRPSLLGGHIKITTTRNYLSVLELAAGAFINQILKILKDVLAKHSTGCDWKQEFARVSFSGFSGFPQPEKFVTGLCRTNGTAGQQSNT